VDAETGKSRGPAVIGAAILCGVTLLGFAAPLLPAEVGSELRTHLGSVSTEPWAPAIAILAFVALASLGVPQIVLITTTVVVFGPWAGFAYSWTGKVLACALGFLAGRRFGAAILRCHQSERVAEFMSRLGKHGFLVSAGVRLVPTVPSVLVNVAAGATPIRFRDFIAGTALGSVPKIALMAYGGHAAVTAIRDDSANAWIGLAIAAVIWGLLAVAGRLWFGRARSPRSPGGAYRRAGSRSR